MNESMNGNAKIADYYSVYYYRCTICLLFNITVRRGLSSNDVKHSPGKSIIKEKNNFSPNTGSVFDKEINKTTKLSFFTSEEVDKLIDELWSKHPIVDGLLEPHKHGINFTSEIAIPTQTNVFSGKLKLTSKNPYFEHTKDTYERFNYENSDHVNFVKNARDISCRSNSDIIPEFIHYQQKPWATPAFNTGVNSNKLEKYFFKEWIDTVSIMIQPYYSKSSNEELYWYDQHYAGDNIAFQTKRIN